MSVVEWAAPIRTWTVSYSRTYRTHGDGQFRTTELTMTFRAPDAEAAVDQWRALYAGAPDAQFIGVWQGGDWP